MIFRKEYYIAEYTNNDLIEVPVGGSIIFNNSISCNRGYIYHRNESGVFILRGIVNNPTQQFARYQIVYNGNVSVPEGETPAALSFSIAIDGEAIPTSTAIVTPTVAEAFFNITSTAIIDCPKCCCLNVSIVNNGTIPTDVQNSNLVINRVA